MDSGTFKKALSQFATGVCIVTTKTANGAPYGITINAFSSLSLEPPLVLFCLNKHARIHAFMEKADAFAIHMLAEGQQNLSNHFAKSGMGGNFDDVDYETKNGLVLLKNTLGVLVCKKHTMYDGGDHTIFIGRVEEILQSPENTKPLLYFNRGYRALIS